MAIGNCNRTLFVEDHEDTREVMSGLLSRSGLTVDQARDAKGALALAERADYDLLLIDIGLPGMNGLVSTARRESARPRAARVSSSSVFLPDFASPQGAVCCTNRLAADTRPQAASAPPRRSNSSMALA